ncbi:MAG: metalloprotease [Flavobacteriaceae bacterium]
MPLFFVLGGLHVGYGQHQAKIDAVLHPDVHQIDIQHKLTFKNNFEQPIHELYLTDWTSSYSSPTTPLVKKFLNEFNPNLYIAKPKDRGFTTINYIKSSDQIDLNFYHLKNQEDILKIELEKALLPNESITLDMDYVLKIQSDRYTDYGVDKKGNYALDAWYLTPVVFDGNNWKLYSNQNLDDLYTPAVDTQLNITIPDSYHLNTALNEVGIIENNGSKVIQFEGLGAKDPKIFITSEPFNAYTFDGLTIVTNANNKKIDKEKEKQYFKRITEFLDQNVAPYPKEKLLLSSIELKNNALYGLTFLPDFLSPFTTEFKYEITLAENIIKKYINEVLVLDTRDEYWLKSGFELLLLMRYIDTYYPDQKLLGKLADVWGIRRFNFSKLKYSEQYRLTYYQMMRTGRDQALDTKKEDLINFNQLHVAKFKAGISLMYLMAYLEEEHTLNWIQEFINLKQFQPTSTAEFRSYLTQKTDRDLDWFFDDFVTQPFSSDYKFSSTYSDKDSIHFTIKNLRKGNYPVTISALKDGEILSTEWMKGFKGKQKFSMANNGADQLVLNYDHSAPEFNRRNNWKRIDKTGLFNKPLQLRFLRDVEDPAKTQIYAIPIAEFQNIYDGLKLGVNFNNRGLLAKPFLYGIAPVYGLESKTITGFGKVIFNIFHEDTALYRTMFGLTVDRSSFDYGAFITKIQPYIQFEFRELNNLRSNASRKLTFRYFSIQKDKSRSVLDENNIPPYNVFNFRYANLDNNIDKFKKWVFDLQFSNDFGKLNTSYEIRKRTPKNRYYNLRLFAGTFLYNTLPIDENNFDFALDRPTDYLFEYNYIGQSESSGILAQQLVVADGGFKSKIDPGFANQWLTTLNGSASIWRYVQAYGDVGLVKNKGQDVFFAYDTGIRMDLITDYFEVYFPMYSNLGWEIDQSNYPQKIRFVFTTDFSALASLFTRRWF